VREGLAKHHTAYDHPGRRKGFAPKIPRSKRRSPTSPTKSPITATTSTTAWIPELAFGKETCRQRPRLGARRAAGEKGIRQSADECRRYFIIRTIIDMQITTWSKTANGSSKAGVQSADDVRRCQSAHRSIQPGTPQAESRTARYLYKNLYYNPSSTSRNLRAVKMLGNCSNIILKHPKEIGESAQNARKSACTAPCAITSPA
jgi:hypothetical protein